MASAKCHGEIRWFVTRGGRSSIHFWLNRPVNEQTSPAVGRHNFRPLHCGTEVRCVAVMRGVCVAYKFLRPISLAFFSFLTYQTPRHVQLHGGVTKVGGFETQGDRSGEAPGAVIFFNSS